MIAQKATRALRGARRVARARRYRATAALTDDRGLRVMLHNNLGTALQQLGATRESIEEHRTALALLNEDVLAHDGGTRPFSGCCSHGRQRGALPARRSPRSAARARAAPPGSLVDLVLQTRVDIFKARKVTCDWGADGGASWDLELSSLVADVSAQQLAQSRNTALLPFDTLSLPVRGAWRRVLAEQHARALEGRFAGSHPPSPPRIARRANASSTLNVGYLCYDFNDHPTTHLIEGLLRWHERLRAVPGLAESPAGAARRRSGAATSAQNRAALAIAALSYGKDDSSAYRQAVVDAVGGEAERGGGFVDLTLLGDHEAVNTARAWRGGVHVAVDLQVREGDGLEQSVPRARAVIALRSSAGSHTWRPWRAHGDAGRASPSAVPHFPGHDGQRGRAARAQRCARSSSSPRTTPPSLRTPRYYAWAGRAGAIDWNIVDRHVAPGETTRAHFSEKLVMLPHSYQVREARRRAKRPRSLSPPAQVNYYERVGLEANGTKHSRNPSDDARNALRVANGLPRVGEGFVLANFNKQDKLEPGALATWLAVRVLAAALVARACLTRHPRPRRCCGGYRAPCCGCSNPRSSSPGAACEAI